MLAFKILPFKKSTNLATILNHNFLKAQFSNDLFSVIWLKIIYFIYEKNRNSKHTLNN
jgi:hypothetical protein